MSKELTDEQERERATWQYRAVLETRGNQTPVGTMLLSVLGRPAKNPPRFGRSAAITKDGVLVTTFQARDGSKVTFTCQLQEVIDNFRRLSETLKLTEVEATEMFVELQRWIAFDERVKQS